MFASVFRCLKLNPHYEHEMDERKNSCSRLERMQILRKFVNTIDMPDEAVFRKDAQSIAMANANYQYASLEVIEII
jgi:hypothetical protein